MTCSGSCGNFTETCSCQGSVIDTKKILPVTSCENTANSFSIVTKAKKSGNPSETVEFVYNSEAQGSTLDILINNIHEEIIVTIVDLINNLIGQSNYPVVLPTFDKDVHLLNKQSFKNYFVQGDGSSPVTNPIHAGKVSYVALSMYPLMERVEAHILTNSNLSSGTGLFSCAEAGTSRALKSVTENCLFDYEFVYN